VKRSKRRLPIFHLRKAIERALAAAAIRFDNRKATELRELEYGLFDGIADEDLPNIFPREYEHYDKHKRFEGEFFAPMPLGESRCNVADRILIVHRRFPGLSGTNITDIHRMTALFEIAAVPDQLGAWLSVCFGRLHLVF
jgi:broad specificity phosphatase PhoE